MIERISDRTTDVSAENSYLQAALKSYWNVPLPTATIDASSGSDYWVRTNSELEGLLSIIELLVPSKEKTNG